MKKVILAVLYSQSPHILNIVMTEDEARSKMEQWRGANPAPFLFGYDREGDMYYCIRMTDIASLHTIDLEKAKRQQEEAQKREAQRQGGMPSMPPKF